MTRWLLTCLILVLGTVTACDIQPVAVGQWQVNIESDQGIDSQTWTINNNGLIEIRSDTGTVETAVETAGSRFSWTLGPATSDVETPRNFSGTVNGNRFSGTLFSQAGNVDVSGNRL